jgi:tRNA(His) 5'-end guanylyltransferase
MDSLGDRMKTYYEGISKTKLMRRTPVAIRIDGKAFHTFTRGFNKPYDVVFSDAMCNTLKSLCENIQGCVLGYTQSDEITLLLVDYKTLNTSAWFDNEVQKMCSVSASMAAAWFGKHFRDSVALFKEAVGYAHYNDAETKKASEHYGVDLKGENARKLLDVYQRAANGIAVFDSRVFNIPKEEVANMFVWRQQDATRNSIEMLGQYHFGAKMLHKKNCSNIQDMLMEQKGVNWNDVEVRFKRGTCCRKKGGLGDGERGGWVLDFNIPVFTQDRNYIEKWIYIAEEKPENEAK